MNKNLFTYIAEFLAVMAIVINSIQFLLFSLVGIEYDPERGTGLVAIVNVACCLYTVAWVLINEIRKPQSKYGTIWPYFFPILIILSYFIESTIMNGLGYGTFPGRQFIFFGTTGVPAIYLATYIYRHDRFDIITRSSDIIMLICSLALILNFGNMNSGEATYIGGGGGHQEISYIAAFCFGINWVNIISGNMEDRFPIFQKKICRYLFFILLPIQALICIMGGGRGGGVLLILNFVTTMFVFARQHFSKTMLYVLLAVAMFFIVATESGQFINGFGRTFNYLEDGKFSLENDASDMERTGLREKSYQIIGESPIIGYGIWNGLKVAGFYMHNVFLDVAIAGGFVYLLIFLLLMARIYKSGYRLIVFDTSKSVLLPWILFPTTMLMFSGYYLANSYFWFFCIYCWLSRKQSTVI